MRAKPKKPTSSAVTAADRKARNTIDVMPHYKGDQKARTRVVTPDLAHQVKQLNRGRKSRV